MSQEIQEIQDGQIIEFFNHLDHDKCNALEDKIIERGINDRELLNKDGMKDILVNGMYARALTIQAGTFVTGKVHLNPYIDVMVSGDITVKSLLHDGSVEDTRRLNSFEFIVGVPGRKRVVFAHKETLWLTIDPTKESDVDKCEDDIAVFKLSDFEALKEALCQ